MNIYLDINDLLGVKDQRTAHLADAFIKAITKHQVCWLARDHSGEEVHISEGGVSLLSKTSLRLIETVRFMVWDLARTEVIDFSQPFLWFTPQVYDEELEDLVTHECLRNLVTIDFLQDTDQLQRLTKSLPRPVTPNTLNSPYKHLYEANEPTA